MIAGTMPVVTRRWRIVLVLIAGLAIHCAPALADGDPASDFLLEEQVFLPPQAVDSTQPQSTAQRQLDAAVRTANRQGFPIRVAIIPDSYDLGSVQQLWREPKTYARFLGIELSYSYKGRLLVVMPDGFGFNWPGHATGPAASTLARVPIGTGEAGEVNAATVAVRALAAAAGVRVARSAAAGSPGASLWPLAAGVALMLALALGGLAYRHRRSHPRASTPAASAPPQLADAARPPAGSAPAPHSPRRRWRPYALACLVVLVLSAAAVPVIANSGGKSPAHGSGGPRGRPPEPAAAWPAGQRPAPDFGLVDQFGQRVAPSAYRGRPVLITFIDPLCRNLCPLEAHVLNQLDRSLPAAQRPEIIAVSVDLWADTRADLLQDYSKWSLVPQWRWAVGSASQLESVWQHYAVEVDVETKRIAGTTVHFIGHDEMAYLIDPRGYERALFVWPFRPADVERTLRQLRT